MFLREQGNTQSFAKKIMPGKLIVNKNASSQWMSIFSMTHRKNAGANGMVALIINI